MFGNFKNIFGGSNSDSRKSVKNEVPKFQKLTLEKAHSLAFRASRQFSNIENLQSLNELERGVIFTYLTQSLVWVGNKLVPFDVVASQPQINGSTNALEPLEFPTDDKNENERLMAIASSYQQAILNFLYEDLI